MLYHKTYRNSESHQWVVLIHGAGGSSSIWFKQIRDLKRHFNVLLLDLRGHGKSKDAFHDHTHLDYSFDDVSRDVIQVLDYLNITSAHFMGVSLGTIIIRTIAELDLSKIKSMILCGAITRFNTRSRFLMRLAGLVRRFIPFIWLYTVYAYILMPKKRNKEPRSMFIQEASKIRRSEYLRWFRLTIEVNPLLRYFNEKDIPVPTLYVMGDEDYMFLPQVKNLVKKHQYAVLQIVENCGHVCNVEQPEVFNRLSLAFLQKYATVNNS